MLMLTHYFRYLKVTYEVTGLSYLSLMLILMLASFPLLIGLLTHGMHYPRKLFQVVLLKVSRIS